MLCQAASDLVWHPSKAHVKEDWTMFVKRSPTGDRDTHVQINSSSRIVYACSKGSLPACCSINDRDADGDDAGYRSAMESLRKALEEEAKLASVRREENARSMKEAVDILKEASFRA